MKNSECPFGMLLLRAPTSQHILHSITTRVLCFTSKRREIQEVAEENDGIIPYMDVPTPWQRRQRKPYPTPMKELIRRAKEDKRKRRESPCRVLENPPDNGLLVPDLVDVAHKVYGARRLLLHGVAKLLSFDGSPAVKKCRYCSEIHIGHQGHEVRNCEGPKSGSRGGRHVWRSGGIHDVVGFPYCYHLYDRVGEPRVGHKDRFRFRRLPAIIELCVQAGLDLEDYPTKRRKHPVHSIEGRIVDFLPEEEENYDKESVFRYAESSFFEDATSPTMPELGDRVIGAWVEMREGAIKIMEKYNVVTCGYCPEVQVGPKGHKVRMCKAAKHQSRDGQHAWQEATIDDVIRPNYVWHVKMEKTVCGGTGGGRTGRLGAEPANELKRYYGKAPAVVGLCVQAGASPPNQYLSMMRLDVVPPLLDEYDLVA